MASADYLEDVVRILDACCTRADDLQRKHLKANDVTWDVIAEAVAIHRIERKTALRQSVLAGLQQFDAVMEADICESDEFDPDA